MSKKGKKVKLPPTKIKEKKVELPASEYKRFTEDHLPKGMKKWPPGLREPAFSATDIDASGIANGLYYSIWPDGQLKTVVNVYNHKIKEWLRLDENIASGTWVCGYVAQKYYTNGEMEDFHPWADSDPAYPADMSFERWVNNFIDGMKKLVHEKGYK
ncbi:MAG: hypothetical protein LWY06_09275 [Firmicutes bacterium]|nr:hypothetical protein [Bacillota bacterium]